MRTRMGRPARRNISALVAGALLASLVHAVVAPSVAEADGALLPPPVPSAPVAPVSSAPRGTDQATFNALRGDQPVRPAQDGGGTSSSTSLAPSATWDVS